MNPRLAVYDLAERYALDAPRTRQLLAAAGFEGEPAAVRRWLWPAVAGIGAALCGLGLILWLAANWETLGRFGRFALLQGLVLVLCLGAALRPRLAPPFGLLALLATGGLFAYFGQTYQTGADPWQLFAVWAALTLPLCLGIRSDLLWAPWSLVVMTGISLWVQAHTGHAWRLRPEDATVYGVAWLAMAAVVAALGPAARRWTGAGPWSLRTAGTLAVAGITLTALAGLFLREVGAMYALGLVVLALCAAVLSLRGAFEIFLLSAVALGLNTLLVAGLARLLFEGRGDFIGHLFLLGLAAAGLLAWSVSWILRLSRTYSREAQ
jgi:uncharacterized membrane protein